MLKHVRILFLALVSLLVYSCANDEGGEVGRVRFTAHSPKSRTALTTDDNVIWKVGDKVMIYSGKNATGTDVVESDSNPLEGPTAYFTVDIDVPEAGDNFYAVYPSSAAGAIADGAVSVTVPTTQTVTDDSFDPAAAVSVASVAPSGWNLYFYNVCALIPVTVAESFTGRIALEGASIAGGAKVSNIPAGPGSTSPTVAYGVTEGSVDVVELSGSFETGKTYYIAIIPHTYTSIALKVYKSATATTPSNTKTFTPTNPFAIYPSDIIEIPKFHDIEPQPAVADYVDLQLPTGTLWATCNVGANAPEEYGLFFQWGDIEGHTATENFAFGWTNYKYANGSSTSLTKYCTDSDCWDGVGVKDDKTELELDDDAAYKVKGTSWRMPTPTQVEELADPANTTIAWQNVNGINGVMFTSTRNGKELFIPAAGYFNGASNTYMGTGCYVYTRILESDYPYHAQYLYGTGTPMVMTNHFNRCYGVTVRAVKL